MTPPEKIAKTLFLILKTQIGTILKNRAGTVIFVSLIGHKFMEITLTETSFLIITLISRSEIQKFFLKIPLLMYCYWTH